MHSSRMHTGRMLLYGGLPDRDPTGQTPPGQRSSWIETSLDRDPLDRDNPGQRPPLDGNPLWTKNPLDRDCPGQRPPWTETP